MSTNFFPRTCSTCTRLVQIFYHSSQIPDFLVALPQKLFSVSMSLCYSVPWHLNKGNPRWREMETEGISDAINTVRIKTNKRALMWMTAQSVLSEDVGWKPGYDEVSENFVIQSMRFSPSLQGCCSEDEAWTLFGFPVPHQLSQWKYFSWTFLLETGFATKVVEKC